MQVVLPKPTRFNPSCSSAHERARAGAFGALRVGPNLASRAYGVDTTAVPLRTDLLCAPLPARTTMTADPPIPNDPRRPTKQELCADRDRAAVRWERLDAEYTMMLDDPGVIQEDRDNVRTLLEEAKHTLEVADAALLQLAGGTYGRCVGCGAAIDPERLDALPGTTMCVTCQTGA